MGKYCENNVSHQVTLTAISKWESFYTFFRYSLALSILLAVLPDLALTELTMMGALTVQTPMTLLRCDDQIHYLEAILS